MKTFILDTNVLLHDPKCIFNFEDNQIIIPLSVLEELDTFKTAPGEKGHNTREIIRTLDSIRSLGKLREGVKLDSGSMLFVLAAPGYTANKLNFTVDNLILNLAQYLIAQRPDSNIIVVTKDINLRVKADALDIAAEDYKTGKIREVNQCKGWDYVEVHNADIQDTFETSRSFVQIPEETELDINQFVLFRDEHQKPLNIMGMYKGKGVVKKLPKFVTASNIKPKNLEQTFALAGLLDDDIKLISLLGSAGVGKTLLCVAAAIEKVMIDQKYDKIIITRPIVPIGRDIGFLPGTINEKMDPWIKPFQDNLDYIKSVCERKKGYTGHLSQIDEFLEIAPITYVRGRSISNSFIIVDEAQNLTQSEMKTILTRVGENSKIIFLGDITQIDCPFLDKWSNGLSYLIEKFRGNELYAHVELSKSERSKLSEYAAQLL